MLDYPPIPARVAKRLAAALSLVSLLAIPTACDLFSSGAPPVPPPVGAVTGLSCRAKDGKVDLAWNATAGAFAYRIERETEGETPISLEQAPGLAYADFQAAPLASYTYRVFAVAETGEGEAASCQAGVGSAEGPSAPADLVCRPKDGKIDLAWSAAPGAVRYRILRSVNGAPQAPVGETTSPVFADFATANDTPQSYRVIALDGRGRSSAESEPCSATSVAGGARGEPPSAISDLACRPKGEKADLTWSPAANAAFYRVLRSVDGGPAAVVGQTAGKVFIDFSLEIGRAYGYTVESVGPRGAVSAASNGCAFTAAGRSSGNRPPLITSQPLTVGLERHIYYYAVAAGDPDGDSITYSLVGPPSGMEIEPSSGFVSWAPVTSQIGPNAVELRATDAKGAFASQAFVVEVADFNEPPVFTSTPFLQARVGLAYVYPAQAFEPDGQQVRFGFAAPAPPGMEIDPVTGAVTWIAGISDVGEAPITLSVVDPLGAFSTQSFRLKVAGDPLDLVSPNGSFEVRPGETLRLRFVANYRDAGFRVRPLVPHAEVQGDEFVFTPEADQEGDFDLAFEAVLGDLRDVNAVSVRVRRANQPPLLSPIGEQRIEEGERLEFAVSASDPDGDALRLSAPGLAVEGAIFDELSSRFTFTPSYEQAGEFVVVFAASDGRETAQQSVRIVVDEKAPPIEVTDLVLDPVPSPTFVGRQTISGSTKGQAQTGPADGGPLVTGLAPTNLRQGRRTTVALTGLRTQFTAGAVTADFGAGISVEQVEVVSLTQLRVTVAAALDAAVGVRAVRVSQPTGEAPSVVAFSVEAGAAEVSGVLLDSFTGQPLAGARVSVLGAIGVFTTTDAQGHFTLDGIAPGGRVLVVTQPNYAVRRVEIAVGANSQIDLGPGLGVDALARPFQPGGSLPRAATVASVLDRGVTSRDADLSFEQARAAVQDAMLAIGGDDTGVLDDAGNQLNPRVVGPGLMSLTPGMLDHLAERIVQRDVYTFGQLAFMLEGSLAWALPEISFDALRLRLQLAANAAWADPGNPAAGGVLLLLNEGHTLDAAAPTITAETRFNALQAYLFVAAQLLQNLDGLNRAVDEKLHQLGLDPGQLLRDAGYGPALYAAAPSKPTFRGVATWALGSLQQVAARALVQPAWAANPAPPPPPNTVPVPQRQTWYGAVAKNFLPALGAGLAAGLIAFAITGLLALIAFFTGAAVLGVTGAIGVVLFAAAASALSAFLAKLIIAAIAHPDAAIDNQPKPPSQMEVRAGTVAGERKAKIIFRRSDSDLERERKLGAGENDSGNWNIDIFNVVSGSIDPRYVDHRYYLFRFDDPTLPLEFKNSKATYLDLDPLPVPLSSGLANHHEYLKFVVPSKALQQGDNWLGIVTVQFYRRMWTEVKPDSIATVQIAYPDLGLDPANDPMYTNTLKTSLTELQNNGMTTSANYTQYFIEQKRADVEAAKLQQRQAVSQTAQKIENEVQNVANEQASTKIDSTSLGRADQAEKAALEEVQAIEKRLTAINLGIKTAFADKTALQARQQLAAAIHKYLQDPKNFGGRLDQPLADAADPRTNLGYAVRNFASQPGVSADALQKTQEVLQKAWLLQNFEVTHQALLESQREIRKLLLELDLAEAVVKKGNPFRLQNQTLKLPTLAPNSLGPNGVPRISTIPVEIVYPDLIPAGDLATIEQLRNQLRAEQAFRKGLISNLEEGMTPLQQTLKQANAELSKKVDASGQKILELVEKTKQLEIERAKHQQALKQGQEIFEDAFAKSKLETNAVEDALSKPKTIPALKLNVPPGPAPAVIASEIDATPPSNSFKARIGAGDYLGFALNITQAAYAARDELEILKSTPSALTLVRKEDGQVVVPEGPIHTGAREAEARERLLARIAVPREIGSAFPEPPFGSALALARPLLRGLDPFLARVRAPFAIEDSGEPAGLTARQRLRLSRREQALRQRGWGLRPVQATGTSGFPIPFESDPDGSYELAILRPTPPLAPNPKEGFLVRDFPFTGPDAQLIEAGFPSDVIAVDGKGAVYLQNLSSSQSFGGRIFRYQGQPIVRELVGAMSYYSFTLQYARPVQPIAMEIADFVDPEHGKVENLFIAELDPGIYFDRGIQPTNRIHRLPIHQLKTVPFYADPANRHRLVMQPYAEHPDFQMTGPSDLEADRKVRGPDPTAPRALFFSDEENLFVLQDTDRNGKAEVSKLVSIPGRRWSGIVVDAGGNLFLADYSSGEVFLLPSDEIDRILFMQLLPIGSNTELDQRGFLIKVGLEHPGDIELDTWEQRYLVSTSDGIEAFYAPIVGRLLSGDIVEMHVEQVGRQLPVTIRRERGNIFFAGGGSEGTIGSAARIRVKRIDAVTRKGVWTDASILASPFGASVLKSPL